MKIKGKSDGSKKTNGTSKERGTVSPSYELVWGRKSTRS